MPHSFQQEADPGWFSLDEPRQSWRRFAEGLGRRVQRWPE
jgi:hypothetical protein